MPKHHARGARTTFSQKYTENVELIELLQSTSKQGQYQLKYRGSNLIQIESKGQLSDAHDYAYLK